MQNTYQPKLSTSGKIAVALTMAFIGQVAVAAPANYQTSDFFAAKKAQFEQQQEAQRNARQAYRGAAAGMQQPTANIEAIANNAQVFQQNQVDIVNIVKANEQGLSHNQFNKFNVSDKGAVLNNAVAAGKSQLAGDLAANANLQGKAASVILNEVVSKNPSLILGQQEIFGMAADYVLANPNGITYNGGSILNANRASLVVGRPDIQGGSLKAFTVGENGERQELRVNGTMSGNHVVDLIAPKVVVSKGAKLDAKNAINVVSGANKVSYQDGQVEKLAQAENAPVLDGQVFGSMRAGSIRIHGTDSRAVQKIEGANLQADNALNINAAGGDVQVSAAKLSAADITFTAKNTVVDGLKDRTTDNYSLNSTEAKNVKAQKFGNTLTETFTGSSISATGALNFQNSGDVSLNAAKVDAGSLNADVKNFATDVATTVETFDHNYNRSKGLWYNNTQTTSSDATVHNTQINVKGAATVNAAETVALKAAVLNVGGDAKFTGKTGISTTGVTETDTSSEHTNFKNETAALKTGFSSKSERNQKQIGTQINVGGDLGLVSDNALNTKATQIKAGGSVVTDVANVNLGTQTTANESNVDDKLKYWGGIGGGKDGQANQRNETLHGTSIVAEGSVLLGAKEAVAVAGGTVKGKAGAFVNAAQVDVKHATTTDIASSSNRTGTIFNITKSKTQNSSSTQNVTGTVLESDADLQVVAQKDINVVGSSLKAAQKLGIKAAGDLNIAAAQAHNTSRDHEFSIKGKATPSASLKDASASIGLGLVITNGTTTTNSTLNTGSQLTGADVDLTADENIKLVGSQVNATNNVDVKAQNVSVEAAKDVVVTDEGKRVTDVGITLGVSYNGGAPKASVTAGVVSKRTDTETTNTTAQVSGISAGNDVTVTADNNIRHEGTKIQAQGNVTQTAQNITNDAAQNSSNVSTTQSQGGISLGVSADTSKKVGATLSIFGEGGKAQTTSTTAVAGSVEANNVNLTATETVTDVGTNYTAQGDVNVNASSYINQAAENTQSIDSKQGGASATLGASTRDFQSVDVDLGVKVHYSDEQGKSSQAVKGNVNAANVNINTTDKVEIASNVTATENVNITAGEGGVTFTQSKDTAESKGTKVDVGVTVGAKVHASGAVAPRGGVDVGVAVNNATSSTGSAGTVTAGKDIVATANNGDVKVDGADLLAGNLVKLDGNKVEVNGLTDTRTDNGVAVGVKLGVTTDLNQKTTTETVTTTEQHMVQDTYCEPPRLVLVEKQHTVETTTMSTDFSGGNFGIKVGVKKEDEVSNKANTIAAAGGITTTPEIVIPGDQSVTYPKKDVPEYDANGTVVGTTTVIDYNNPIITTKPDIVIPGKSEQTGGVIINANSSGNGLSITGTNVHGGAVSLTNAGGNVHVGSMEGHLNKTNVNVGAAASISVSGDQVKGGSASVDVGVDLAKNKTFTGSSITATQVVNVNAKDDLSLVSSTVSAPEVKGNVGGNVDISAQQNVVDETAVNVGIGAGYYDHAALQKPAPKTDAKPAAPVANQGYTADNSKVIAAAGTVIQGAQTAEGIINAIDKDKKGEKIERDDIAAILSPAAGALGAATQNSKLGGDLQKDVATGSILGVHAHLNLGYDVDKSKQTVATGITANNLDLQTAGTVTNQVGQIQHAEGSGFGNAKVETTGANVDSSKHMDGHLNLTTDVSQNIAYIIEHAKTGKSPVAGFNSSSTAPTTVTGSMQSVAADQATANVEAANAAAAAQVNAKLEEVKQVSVASADVATAVQTALNQQ